MMPGFLAMGIWCSHHRPDRDFHHASPLVLTCPRFLQKIILLKSMEDTQYGNPDGVGKK
jgi:hypothetical protein